MGRVLSGAGKKDKHESKGQLVQRSRRALAQRLEFFVREMPLGCILWDQDGRVIEWNQAAEHIFGWSESEAFQQRYEEFLAPEAERDASLRLWDELLEGGDTRQRCETRTKGRGLIECQWFHTALRGEGGRVVAVASMAEDVTERRALERQLLQTEKLEAVAILAGGIAHDFNNLLTSVLGNVSLALMKLGPRHHASNGLKNAETAAERAAELTRQLLRFSRRAPGDSRPCDLNRSIEEGVALLKHGLPPGIHLETRLAPALWPVDADPGQLVQVVMNLCVNARDAVGPDGSIRIESANRKVSAGFCRQHPEARLGEFAELVIHDNGSGIDEQTLNHVFEPFFTTKEAGKGTGLGLAIVYGIVKHYSGWVTVSSRSGKGSTFRVYLPRAVPGGRPRPRISKRDLAFLADSSRLLARTEP